MARLGYHPAPGINGLLPGFYNVPQNPIQPVTYTRGISEILPGSFPVPQNPVKDYTRGQTKLIGQNGGGGVSGCGGSCGCGGGCSSGQINGVGIGDISSDWATFQSDISSGNYMEALQATFFGVPVWAVAGALTLVMFAGGSKHSYAGRGRRAARAAAGAW